MTNIPNNLTRGVATETGKAIDAGGGVSRRGLLIAAAGTGAVLLAAGGAAQWVVQGYKDEEKARDEAIFREIDEAKGVAVPVFPIRSWSTGKGEARKVAFSPDGRTIISCFGDDLKLWETASGTEIKAFESMRAVELAFSPDGRSILATNTFGARLMDVASGRKIWSVSLDSWGHAAAFSPDGQQILYAGSSSVLTLLDAATGQTIKTFSGHTKAVKAVAFSPDGRLAASGSEDTTLKLWDIASGQEIRTFSPRSSEVRAVAFTPDGRSLLTGASGVKLWNVATGEEIPVLGKPYCVTDGLTSKLMFTPDGQRLLCCGFMEFPVLLNANTYKQIKVLRSRQDELEEGPDSDVVALSRDGRFAAAGGTRGSIYLWDLG